MTEETKELSVEEMGRLALNLLRELAQHDPTIARTLTELGLAEEE